MKRLGLMVCCWFCGVGLYAQTDFRPGYILTHKNDTVHGLVDFRTGERKMEVCSFKKSGEATVTDFTAADISGYGFINDRLFVSKPIKSHTDTFDNVFVELIVRGRISLFRRGDDFYVSKDSSTLYALTNETMTKNVNGKRVVVESNRFVGVLNHLMSDCDQVQRQVSGLKLFEKALTAVVERYNLCGNGVPLTFKARLPFLHVSAGASGGVAINFLEFNQNSPSYESLQGSFAATISPYAGISVDLSSPRINDRIAFHAGVSYAKTDTKSFHEVKKGYYVDRHFVTVTMTSLQVPLGIKYTFAERRFTPYVNGGVLNSYNVKSATAWIRETEVDGVVETYESDDIQIKRNQIGLWGGLGVRKSIFSSADLYVELRYSKSLGSISTLESANNVNPTISGLQFFLGIRTK